MAPAPAPAPADDEGHGGVDMGGDDQGAGDAQGDPNAPVDYEHRFKVLQGKYNAETRTLRDQVRTTQERLDQTTNLFTSLAERQPRETPAEPVPPVLAPLAPITPLAKAELDEFGEDMLDASARFTSARVMPIIESLRAEVARLTGLVNATAATVNTTASTVALSARERMFSELDKNVPTWRAVNTEDGFLNWLAQEDGLSGDNRHALLKRAFESNETARVQRFFSAYLSESASGGEHATGRVAKPNQPNAPSVVSPSALVAPGRGRAAPVQGAPVAMEWTPALIRSFYDDVRNGVFRDNPDERQRLEADIFAAQREGRIFDA